MTAYTGDQFCSAALFVLLDAILHFTKQEDCICVRLPSCVKDSCTEPLWMSVSITATAAG